MINRPCLTIMLVATLGVNYASAMQPTAATAPTHNTEIATLTQALHDRLGKNSAANCLSQPILQEIAAQINPMRTVTFVSRVISFKGYLIRIHYKDTDETLDLKRDYNRKEQRSQERIRVAPLSIELRYDGSSLTINNLTAEQVNQIGTIKFERGWWYYCEGKVFDKSGQLIASNQEGDPTLE